MVVRDANARNRKRKLIVLFANPVIQCHTVNYSHTNTPLWVADCCGEGYVDVEVVISIVKVSLGAWVCAPWRTD